MKRTFFYASVLMFPVFAFSQAPVDISYNLPGSISANGLTPTQIANAPKECVIDFHCSAPSVRVIMESPDGSVNYVNRVFSLELQTFPDSTYVYGQSGAWSIGLGQFEGVNAFRIKLVNAMGNSNAVIAQSSYP